MKTSTYRLLLSAALWSATVCGLVMPATGVLAAEPAADSRAGGIFADFNDWSIRYQAALESERGGMETRGRELALERRERLRSLIQVDPKAALEQRVAYGVRQKLPPPIAGLLEESVSGRGTLGVVGMAPPAEAGPEFQPISRTVQIGDRIYQAHVYGRRQWQSTKVNIPLHGIAVDGEMAVHEDPVRVLDADEARAVLEKGPTRPSKCPVSGDPSDIHGDPRVIDIGGETQVLCQGGHIEVINGNLAEAEGTGPTSNGVATSAWSQGDKTLLYIRVRFSDQTSDPQSDTSSQDMMTSVNNFFVENSYNTTTITATITPVIVLSKTTAEYTTAGIYTLRSDALAAAQAAGFDYTTYTFDAVRYNGGPGSFGGAAYVGSRGCWLKSSSAGVAAHEFGHNYGLWHANNWAAQNDSIIGSAGTWTEYGDSFDTMGSAGAGVYHFNTRYKSVLDWIPAGGYQSVTASGLYRVYAHDFVTSSAFNRALRIPRSSTKNYWVEFRQRWTGNSWMMNGASIRRADNSNNNNPGSELLDMTPGTPDGKNDSPLVIGRTFSDVVGGVHITPVGKGGTSPESLDVVVNVGSFPGNVAPALSISASATAVSTGTAVIFTASASDANGDDLAYYWEFGDKTFAANTSSATKSWSTAGDYVVRCVVSDMKGGVASRWVLVTVGSPSTFRISGRVTDQSGNPVEGVRLHNGLTSGSYRGSYSDSDGYYLLTGLASGSYTVGGVKPGYSIAASGFANPVVVGPNATAINFVAGPALYSISGTITDGGVAVSGVTVSDGTRTATSNSSGNFTINNVPDGSYTVTASKAGYTFNPSGWSNPVLVDGGNVTARNFITPTYTISGQILGVPTTTVVTVTDGYRTVNSYRQGSGSNAKNVYSLGGVPAGTWHLRATVAGSSFSPANFTNPLTVSGNTTGMNFSLDAAVTYSVSGTITSSDGIHSGVTVSAGSSSGVSDSRGGYYVDRLANGTYSVVPFKSGYSFTPASRSVTVSSAAVTGQNFSAAPGATVPTVTVSVSDAAAAESGPDGGAVVVSRSGSTTSSLIVNYTAGGSASAGGDYAALAGSVTIPAGQSSATIVVTPVDDGTPECVETVVVTLAANPSYTVGAANSGTVTIADNDLPVVTVSVVTATTSEAGGTAGRFRLSRTGCTTGALTVSVSVGGGTADGADFTTNPAGASVVIPAGSASADVLVTAVDDALSESAETVILTVTGAGATYSLGATTTGTVTILDNDTNQPPAVDAGGDVTVNQLSLVSLNGTASDDGQGGALTVEWTVVGSAPGTVFIDDPASPQTTATFAAPGIYTLQLAADDTEFTTLDTVNITVQAADPRRVVRAVNVGGGTYTEASGVSYLADPGTGGGVLRTTTDSILGTLDQDLYQGDRSGAQTYSVPVLPGNYVALLKFADISASPVAGANVFDVKMEGTTRLAGVDVVGLVGAGTALDLAVPVTVNDGALSLELVPGTAGQPALSAFVLAALEPLPAPPTAVTAVGSKRKITLQWTQSATAGITQNRIYRSATSGGPYTLVTTIAAATTYSDNRLTSGSTFFYVVTAVNASGAASIMSNQATATAK